MPIIDSPITANAQSLERVLATPLPQLLLLHHQLNDSLDSTFKQVAKTEAGKLLTIKVNLKENPELAQKYNTGANTPLLIAIQDGKELARHPHPTKDTINNYADYLLGKTAQIQKEEAPKNTKPITVTDENFGQNVLKSEMPVLVDFWATWCPPCRAIAPTLEKLAADLAGQITIAKLDVDNNPVTAMQYGIQSIPTLLVFKNGQVVDKTMGAQPEAALRQFLQKHL